MTFEIYNNLTSQPITLAEFDSKYCTFMGIPELSNEFAEWFNYMEEVFNTYADIADYGRKTIAYKQVVHLHDGRLMTCEQIAQCLLISLGKIVPKVNIESIEYEMENIKKLIRFFLSDSIRNDYYFEFHY